MKIVPFANMVALIVLLGTKFAFAEAQEARSCRAASVDVSHALQKAYENFVGIIADRQITYKSGGHELLMSDIGSYEIRIMTGEDDYIITFVPKGSDIRGGGVRYIVRKCSNEIVGIEGG